MAGDGNKVERCQSRCDFESAIDYWRDLHKIGVSLNPDYLAIQDLHTALFESHPKFSDAGELKSDPNGVKLQGRCVLVYSEPDLVKCHLHQLWEYANDFLAGVDFSTRKLNPSEVLERAVFVANYHSVFL